MENGINDNDYVDLGLPSNNLWMTHLIGMKYDTDIDRAKIRDWYHDWNHEIGDKGCEIPTKGDLDELVKYTDKHFIEINGVKGVKFISRTNSNSLFIPFAGFCSPYACCSVLGQNMSVGLWSSETHILNKNHAYFLHLSKDYSCFVLEEGKANGNAVLGVRHK